MMRVMPRTVGQNAREIVRRLKAADPSFRQQDVAGRGGWKKPADLSVLLGSKALPKPVIIERLARALGCRTSQLMEGVETPYDRLRRDLPLARGRPSGEQSVKRQRTGS
jgi:hypothetical protein